MNIDENLKNLDIENIIWVIYLFLIGANLVSNYIEEKYLYTLNVKYKRLFRTINILVLSIAIIIYIYFFFLASKNKKKNPKKLDSLLLLIASICILIGGVIYLILEIRKVQNIEISII